MHGDAIVAETRAGLPTGHRSGIRAVNVKAHRASNQVILTDGEVSVRLNKAVAAAGSQAAFPRMAGVTRQHLYDVLSGARQPGPLILRVLGLKRFLGGNPVYTVVD